MATEKEFTSKIGKKIRKLREAKDISLTALAERAGISKSYLSHIETGKVENVSLNVLKKITSALKIDLYELLKNIDGPKKKNTSSYGFPFNKKELQQVLSNSEIDESILDKKAEKTLVSLGEILTDPELPVKHINELEAKLCSYAHWLAERIKERDKENSNSEER